MLPRLNWPAPALNIVAALTRANQEWAMDFIVDGLANGRTVRILSVVDAFTRECLALEPDVSLGSGRVTRVVDENISTPNLYRESPVMNG
jgi:putative transposase